MTTVPMETLAEVIELQIKNGRANLMVTGSSMLPMLRHRQDSVMLIPAGEKQQVGDVIFYRRKSGQYILHRIIAQTPGGYICCGDNQFERETVKQAQVIAVVDAFVRKGKQYTCEAPGYRLYRYVWVKLFCMRRGYILFRRILGRLRAKLRRAARKLPAK